MYKFKLKELRESKGLLQGELAKILGLKQMNISKYETGRTAPTFENLIKMADYFDVSLDTLLGRDFDNSKDDKINEELFWYFRQLPETDKKKILEITKSFLKLQASQTEYAPNNLQNLCVAEERVQYCNKTIDKE